MNTFAWKVKVLFVRLMIFLQMPIITLQIHRKCYNCK